MIKHDSEDSTLQYWSVVLFMPFDRSVLDLAMDFKEEWLIVLLEAEKHLRGFPSETLCLSAPWSNYFLIPPSVEERTYREIIFDSRMTPNLYRVVENAPSREKTLLFCALVRMGIALRNGNHSGA
ncbi:MAG: hypothetical protein ABW090_05690 [Sedimenticola sp.]